MDHHPFSKPLELFRSIFLLPEKPIMSNDGYSGSDFILQTHFTSYLPYFLHCTPTVCFHFLKYLISFTAVPYPSSGLPPGVHLSLCPPLFYSAFLIFKILIPSFWKLFLGILTYDLMATHTFP